MRHKKRKNKKIYLLEMEKQAFGPLTTRGEAEVVESRQRVLLRETGVEKKGRMKIQRINEEVQSPPQKKKRKGTDRVPLKEQTKPTIWGVEGIGDVKATLKTLVRNVQHRARAVYSLGGRRYFYGGERGAVQGK